MDIVMNVNFTHRFQNGTVTVIEREPELIFNKEVTYYVLLINTWGLGQGVTCLGLIVNILNIIIFIRQGFKESVNVSLFSLTISDLGSLVFLFFLNLCWIPAVGKLDLPFYPDQMIYFLFYGHVMFTRVTTGTTAWIAMERCLCIITPLKVKSLITGRRTVVFVCVLYLISTASCAPLLYTSRFRWIFDAFRNKTLLGLVKIENREKIEGVVYVVNNVMPITFFIVIVGCTVVLSKALLKNAEWRQRTAIQKEGTNRDTKVVKLVLIISLVFIFCYAPGSLFFLWVLIDREMKIDGKQRNFLIAFFG
ncbi:unnamed protein product, partial [Candidula unifasciata]